ncbi:MAG TPA: hypothetical protein VKU19_14955 [Bryobacteraceae bacterium]|nr:hypothetical protein [Bryobacteraceae bacterium]
MANWIDLSVVAACNAVLGGILIATFKNLLSSYAGEKGKNIATKEDVQIIVDNVRAVTREAEAIKAEIQGGVWEHQWLLNQKRDMYAKLLDSLAGAFATSREYADILRRYAVAVASGQMSDKVYAEIANFRDRHYQAERVASAAMMTAAVFVDPRAIETAKAPFAPFQNIGSMGNEPALLQLRTAIDDAMCEIVEIAKSDIGIALFGNPKGSEPTPNAIAKSA